jgi:hypothetical protein
MKARAKHLDEHGAAIAAADRIYRLVVEEAANHRAAHPNDFDAIGELVHLVLMTRISNLGDAGLLSLKDPRIEAITKNLAELEAEARARRETGALLS